MKSLYTIAVNHHEYAKGIYYSYEQALGVAATMARDDNPGEWEELDDDEVYDYQDGYYHVMEIELPANGIVADLSYALDMDSEKLKHDIVQTMLTNLISEEEYKTLSYKEIYDNYKGEDNE